MLHYKSKDWFIGDVHPYYEGGKLYLFYLKPNGITRCDACFEDPTKVVCSSSILAVTDDYADWTEYPISEIVVNIVKLGDTYYCCNGSGERSFVESRDLIHWKPSVDYRFTLDAGLFTACARDYACFWDDDIAALRATMNAYFTNEHNGMGKGLSCCVGISGQITADGGTTPGQRVLLPFPNAGAELMKSMEPECNQAIRIGSRWYLVTSLARQTVHWVGAPSYWIGEENTPIDAQDWTQKQERRLDGEDLCAAQVAQNGEKYYLFGWIPMNWNGQEWGGHLNLPREVYALEDGTLATRLDPEYASKITGKRMDVPVRPEPCARGYRVRAEGGYGNFGVRATLNLQGAASAAIVDENSGVAAVLCRDSGELKIVRMKDGSEDFVFSSIAVPESEWTSGAELHMIYDEDIVELFLNDRVSLCARVSEAAKGASPAVCCDREDGLVSIILYEIKLPLKYGRRLS